MKVNLEVECTPLEARQFFGLPDVQPLQATMMAELEKSILREAQRYSPEALMQVWLTSLPNGAEWMRTMFGSMLTQAQPKTQPPRSDEGAR